jgi:5-methylcytosine-specific restriction protein A
MPSAAPVHRPAQKKERKAWDRTSQQRGKTTTQRGYGWQWQKLRQRIIDRDLGLCQPCKRKDRVTAFHAVDHIVPKAKGGTEDESNLECICKRCHKAKTAREDSK